MPPSVPSTAHLGAPTHTAARVPVVGADRAGSAAASAGAGAGADTNASTTATSRYVGARSLSVPIDANGLALRLGEQLAAVQASLARHVGQSLKSAWLGVARDLGWVPSWNTMHEASVQLQRDLRAQSRHREASGLQYDRSLRGPRLPHLGESERQALREMHAHCDVAKHRVMQFAVQEIARRLDDDPVSAVWRQVLAAGPAACSKYLDTLRAEHRLAAASTAAPPSGAPSSSSSPGSSPGPSLGTNTSTGSVKRGATPPGTPDIGATEELHATQGPAKRNAPARFTLPETASLDAADRRSHPAAPAHAWGLPLAWEMPQAWERPDATGLDPLASAPVNARQSSIPWALLEAAPAMHAEPFTALPPGLDLETADDVQRRLDDR